MSTWMSERLELNLVLPWNLPCNPSDKQGVQVGGPHVKNTKTAAATFASHMGIITGSALGVAWTGDLSLLPSKGCKKYHFKVRYIRIYLVAGFPMTLFFVPQ